MPPAPSSVYSVGIDLTEIGEVRASLERFGDRYLLRIFSPAESRACGANPVRLAEMFAAKEATMKALGWGEAGVEWRSIEVSAPRGARPTVALSQGAAALARARGVTGLTVSLSHDCTHATAVVIAEQRI